MKKINSVMWGIVLVILGVLLGGKALGLFNFNLFFDGWWTLFIIVPCFIGLITDDEKTGSIIGLTIGILLLLSCQDVIDFSLIMKLLIPIVIIVCGISLIIKNIFNIDFNDSVKKLNSKLDNKESIYATFSSQNLKLDNEEFKGTSLNAIFGGIKLDLRDALIKEDIVINACSIFGGIDILVPEDVNIKVKSTSVFGGVDNKTNKKNTKKEITIYVNATCLFGGVDIK